MTLFSHHEFDNHEQVHFFNDAVSGLKAIIAVHNSHRGPALGGCRMFPYANDEDALTDVLRLSRGMTYKSALANLDLGGGKSVIIGDPRQHKTEALLEMMGRCLEKLGGSYIAAEDSGTSVPDLQVIGRHTRNVAGVVSRPGILGQPSSGDPSPATAYGTFIGLKTAVQHRLGRDDLHRLKVAIQGVGNVGLRLARHLHAAGAELYVSDIHQNQLAIAVEELGATVVPSDQVLTMNVDVIAPCAMGAILNDETIANIKAKVVAGAANNQLAEARHDQTLADHGILYAPDFAINAGGIIDIAYERNGGTPEDVMTHLESIAETLDELFTRARETGRPTGALANELAEERFKLNAVT
ncbi:MAG: amino acid dehydrogenase [Marinobacterium sp.]|nr:amino acid dehydrogenase [Marinobacterium sp.]